MKYILFIYIFIAFLTSETLENVMSNILPMNPTIKEAKNEYLISKHELEYAKKGHNPTINLTYDNGKEYTSTFSNLKKKKILNEYKIRLTANLNLFSGFKISHQIKEKEKYKLIAEKQFKKVLIDTSLAFLKNYFYMVKNIELFTIAIENLNIYEETYRKVLSRLEIGLGYESEKYQTLSRVELSRSNKNLSEQNYKISLLNYRTVIRDYSFENNESNHIKLDINLTNFNEEKIIKEYKNNNIDINISKIRANINYDKYKQEMSKFYPTLDLKLLRSTTANSHGLEDVDTISKVYLSLKYNIYNGGRDIESRASQIYKVNKFNNQFENSHLSQLERLKLNLIKYKMEKQKLSILKNQIIYLNKTKYLYKKEFENNKRTILEILNISQELNSAKTQKINLYYDLLLLFFKIKIAEGTYLNFFNLEKLIKLE